ncbi:MAG: hypothetical protein P1P84_25135 [Deferrisomatales bacterium]|nr:hypothetical protein [Deferrisomatales bacterium]
MINPSTGDRWAFPQAKTFSNEWEYHRAMHDRQRPLNGYAGQPLPAAERRAVDERTQTLLDLIERYTMLTSLVGYGEQEFPVVPGYRNPINDALKRVVNPVVSPNTDRFVVDPLIRRMAVSSIRGDLITPQTARSLESVGSVVTNQLVVPFRLKTAVPSSSTPATRPVTEEVDTKLVGTERDYGKAVQVERAAVGFASRCPNPAPETSEESIAMYDLARAAQEVQEQIVSLLIDEYKRGANGCLSENNFNCDWSPALFAKRFKGQFTTEREAAFQHCVSMTAGNTLDNPDPLFRVPTQSRNMAGLPGHFVTVQENLAKELEGLPYVLHNGKGSVGEKVAGGKELGDASWFGASWNYDTGWSIRPEFGGSTSGTAKACEFVGNVNATFDAGISIVGKRIPVVSITGTGDAAGSGGILNTELEFINQTFHPGAGRERIHQVEDGRKETSHASATVVVVAVPVTFEAWGELDFGYDIGAEMTSRSACAGADSSPDLAAKFRLEPFAKVSAVGAASVGVSGAKAGVRGRVTLLDARLPIDASLEVRADPNLPTSIKVYQTTSAALNYESMSGSISAYAEVGWGPASYEAEKEIYSWHQKGDGVQLWEPSSEVAHLEAFNKGLWTSWIDLNRD